MPLIRLKNPLIFPGGSPGFNQGHIASLPGMRFSAVAIPGQGKMTPLWRVKAIGTSGTVNSVAGGFGPAVSPATGGFLTYAAFNETPSTVTFAAIINPTASVSFGFVVCNDSSSGTLGSPSGIRLNSLVVNSLAWNLANVSSGITLVIGQTYFVAISGNSTTWNFVVKNLGTGKVQSATVASSNTPAAQTAASYAVGGAAGQTSANASINAVMYSIGFMSIPQLLEWAQNPWDFWYPPTVQNLIATSLRAPISSAAVKQIDSELPPVLAGASPDLRTAFQTGFTSQGAKAGAQSAELPPLGRGPEPGLRTAFQPGYISQGPSRGAQSADLPPLGRGPSPDLRTAFQPGYVSHGAVAAGFIDALLPPLGRGPSIDLRTAFIAGHPPTPPVAAVPVDASLPPLGRTATIDLRTSYQSGSHGPPAQTQNDDSLPPRLPGRSPDILYAFRAGFMGDPIAVQPQWNYEYPLPPKGLGPSVDLLTWTVSGRVTAQLAIVPASDTSLSPAGRGPSIDLRTSYVSGSHGAVQQKQNDDSLPPLGRGPPIDLSTWTIPGSHGAKAGGPIEASLPPFGTGPAADLRTWVVTGRTVVQVAQVPAYDTSLPPLGQSASVDLRTWIIPGAHGAPAQTRNDDSLPPRGRGPSAEPTWTVTGHVVARLAQVPSYDTSLPPTGQRLPIESLTSYVPGIPPFRLYPGPAMPNFIWNPGTEWQKFDRMFDRRGGL